MAGGFHGSRNHTALCREAAAPVNPLALIIKTAGMHTPL